MIKKIQKGALTLSQISQVQRAVRQCQSEKRADPIQITQDLLSAIESKSAPETQKIISQALDIPVQVTERTRLQKDDSVRFELTLTAEQAQDLKRCREILSNKGRTQWSEVLQELAKEYLKRKDPARQVRKYHKLGQPDSTEGTAKSTATVAVDQRRLIKASVRRSTFRRDPFCQFKNPSTGKICGSKWRLEVDHVQPVWAGGSDAQENLRILCASHNRHRYRQQGGVLGSRHTPSSRTQRAFAKSSSEPLAARRNRPPPQMRARVL